MESQAGAKGGPRMKQYKNDRLNPQIRLCAYSAEWLDPRCGQDSFAFVDEIGWSTGEGIIAGDIQIFCLMSDHQSAPTLRDNDPRLDAIHSLWEAISEPDPSLGNETWPVQAMFHRVMILENPVPKEELLKLGLLRRGWPQGCRGKILHTLAEMSKLATLLVKWNPNQQADILQALGLQQTVAIQYQE
jgi:hypothetical protein